MQVCCSARHFSLAAERNILVSVTTVSEKHVSKMNECAHTINIYYIVSNVIHLWLIQPNVNLPDKMLYACMMLGLLKFCSYLQFYSAWQTAFFIKHHIF